MQTHYQHTSAIRPEDDYKGKIPQLHSSEDRDDDGVDDQLDILNGALAYVSTHPKYKSRYYENGYPDDNYGVCTDVVAYALKYAGYDLQVLVDADIRVHPQDYMVAEPDANIDFRRVRNLNIFFFTHSSCPDHRCLRNRSMAGWRYCNLRKTYRHRVRPTK